MCVCVNAVARQRQSINTEAAIASLEQRDRPLKAKYLKDAYELQPLSVDNEIVASSNGQGEIDGKNTSSSNHNSVGGGDAYQGPHLACQDGI